MQTHIFESNIYLTPDQIASLNTETTINNIGNTLRNEIYSIFRNIISEINNQDPETEPDTEEETNEGEEENINNRLNQTMSNINNILREELLIQIEEEELQIAILQSLESNI